jgi:transcriptional regulator with XRE-family HTH domain
MPSPDELQQVGELLRGAREEIGLRKSEVARRVGVTPAYVSFIESARPSTQGKGNPSQPRRELLVAWPRVVGMDEARAQQVLTLAGHQRSNPAPEALSLRETIQRYEEQPWPVRRDQLVARMREVVRLAEASPLRDTLVERIDGFLDLVEFRLLHDENE